MEDVRMLVQGDSARNLVAFHVDVAAPPGRSVNRKPPSSPRLTSDPRMTKRSTMATKTGSRVRSASAGRDKKSELQARCWGILFGNLQRVVDEIYKTCEEDESVSECKEVILVLENFTRDFHNLIEWFRLKWEYENTPPPQRPTSLAWEVRKSSPIKALTYRLEKFCKNDKSSPVKKQLDFCSDVKLSTAQENDKRVLTPESEQILTNRYGLSFGDVNLRDHLGLETSSVIIGESSVKPVKTSVEMSNKENHPMVIMENKKNGLQSYQEVMSDQSSQTEQVCLPNKASQKVIYTPALTIVKKAPPSSLAKTAPVLTPIAVNKTNQIMSGRKTVPTSPTSTVPPRNVVPGRNVAAATFVPGKKATLAVQPKSNAVGIKCNPIILKTNAPNPTEKCSSEQDQTMQVTTNFEERGIVEEYKISEQKVFENVKSATHENSTLDNVNNDLMSETLKSDQKLQDIKEAKEEEEIEKSDKVGPTRVISVSTAANKAAESQAKSPEPGLSIAQVKSAVLPEVKIGSTEKTNDLSKPSVMNKREHSKVVSIVDATKVQQKCDNIAVESPKVKQSEIAVEVPKVEKCDKIVMTDFPPIGATLPRQQRTVGLIRNKTVPSLMRKSNETINSTTPLKHSDSDTSETIKPTRAHSIVSKYVPKTVKKQISLSEGVNERPPFVTSRIYRSNTALELRSAKRGFNRNVHSTFGQSLTEGKQITTFNKVSNTNIKNQLVMKADTVSKSQQSLRKKNSIDEDGWETVQGRSRSRLSQSSGNIKARSMKASSRFYLPSPATSLPALALIGDETEPDPKPGKVDKDKHNAEIAKANKTIKGDDKTQNAVKMESALKKMKNKEDPNKKSGIERRRISYGRSNSSSDLKKKSNGDKLPNAANDNKLDKLMDMLSSEDERINEEEIRKSRELYEEEKMLTKEIQDLEKAEFEMDTETDDAETDGEANTGGDDDDTDSRISALRASYEDVCDQLSWADQMDTWEKLVQLEQMAMDTDGHVKGLPNSQRRMTLEQLEELVSRHPGRALELHQKLSSPSRRRLGPDTLQRHHARQASAKRKREQLLQDKSSRIRELLNRVEEVKLAQTQLVEERKKRLEDKLKRAEENRASHLRSIQRKAHDEEEKLREIAFINELEAQNKRHDFMALCQEQRDRLQGILDERHRKQEEKAAKEAAVEERRRVLEAERQEKLEKMQERRRKREERIGREQQEKEKERQENAREKARDRVERLQALQAAQLATVEELQKKIQQKQSESARRHEENIEHIRQRALESGVLRAADDEAPRLTPYDTHKLCRVCNIMIESEVYLLSHLRGKAHQEAMRDRDDTEEVITDAPRDKMDAKIAQDRERLKALRKRCKKIRSRMAQRGEEYLAKQGPPPKKIEGQSKGRLQKCLKDVDRLHSTQGVGQWPNNAVTLLERNLSEINRILDKQNSLDQKVFRELNGFTTLSNILNLALDIPKNMSPYLPPKCFLTTCSVYSLACQNNPDNSRFVFCSNKIALVLDILLNRLNTLITDDYRASQKSSANLPVDTVAGALMRLFALILSQAQEDASSDLADMALRLQDMISYTVSVGVVDNLALYCSSVRDPIDGNMQAAHFLLGAVQLLTTLAKTNCGLTRGDPTQLVATLRVTELVGGVSMLYGMLLHQGCASSPPPALPPLTITVTMATLQLLRAVAQLDLHMFQSVLGAEGMSLQLRHVASYLLFYCSHADERELLHEVIQVVGYFAVMNYENQMILQSGHNPTVLQQLVNLPFEYFSNPSLSCHLLPTLLACCHDNPDNKAILTQELSYQLLEDFKQSESGKINPLIQLLK